MEFHQDEEEEEEEEMPFPLSSSYGNNHIVPLPPQCHHQPPKSPPPPPPPPSSSSRGRNGISQHPSVVKYKECLKNHAASIGGKATDGCGEFMACGEEGTLEAFTCSVCKCHRNFHRKEIEGDPYYPPYPHPHPIQTPSYDCNYQTAPSHLKRFDLGGNGRNLIHSKGGGVLGAESLGYHHHNAGAIVPARGPPPILVSYNMGIRSFPYSDDQENGGGGGCGDNGGGGGGGLLNRYPPPPSAQLHKKRYRTKFTQEQKEKMLSFAQKVGWKIQREEESMVQELCQEIGIKRRVLKVWMHNNKQNLAKNINPSQTQDQPQGPS